MLDDAATRWGGKRQFALRTDDGIELPWSARDLQNRSKLAAWRLRRLGLKEGDRLLTWSPATPALPAVYYGAMRAGAIVVPLDLRMAPDVIRRIAEKADTKWLAVGSGYDAPDPNAAGLEHFTIRTIEWLVSDPAHQSASRLRRGRFGRSLSHRLGTAGRQLARAHAETASSRSSTPLERRACPRA